MAEFDLREIKSKLREYFIIQPVIVVYVFGSLVKKKAHPNSDLDLGVLFHRKLNEKEKFDLRLQYQTDVGRMLKMGDRVDVVDVEKAAPALAYAIIQPRQVVVEIDHDEASLNRFHILNRYRQREYVRKHYTFNSLATIARYGLSQPI